MNEFSRSEYRVIQTFVIDKTIEKLAAFDFWVPPWDIKLIDTCRFYFGSASSCANLDRNKNSFRNSIISVKNRE